MRRLEGTIQGKKKEKENGTTLVWEAEVKFQKMKMYEETEPTGKRFS